MHLGDVDAQDAGFREVAEAYLGRNSDSLLSVKLSGRSVFAEHEKRRSAGDRGDEEIENESLRVISMRHEAERNHSDISHHDSEMHAIHTPNKAAQRTKRPRLFEEHSHVVPPNGTLKIGSEATIVSMRREAE